MSGFTIEQNVAAGMQYTLTTAATDGEYTLNLKSSDKSDHKGSDGTIMISKTVAMASNTGTFALTSDDIDSLFSDNHEGAYKLQGALVNSEGNAVGLDAFTISNVFHKIKYYGTPELSALSRVVGSETNTEYSVEFNVTYATLTDRYANLNASVSLETVTLWYHDGEENTYADVVVGVADVNGHTVTKVGNSYQVRVGGLTNSKEYELTVIGKLNNTSSGPKTGLMFPTDAPATPTIMRVQTIVDAAGDIDDTNVSVTVNWQDINATNYKAAVGSSACATLRIGFSEAMDGEKSNATSSADYLIELALTEGNLDTAVETAGFTETFTVPIGNWATALSKNVTTAGLSLTAQVLITAEVSAGVAPTQGELSDSQQAYIAVAPSNVTITPIVDIGNGNQTMVINGSVTKRDAGQLTKLTTQYHTYASVPADFDSTSDNIERYHRFYYVGDAGSADNVYNNADLTATITQADINDVISKAAGNTLGIVATERSATITFTLKKFKTPTAAASTTVQGNQKNQDEEFTLTLTDKNIDTDNEWAKESIVTAVLSKVNTNTTDYADATANAVGAESAELAVDRAVAVADANWSNEDSNTTPYYFYSISTYTLPADIVTAYANAYGGNNISPGVKILGNDHDVNDKALYLMRAPVVESITPSVDLVDGNQTMTINTTVKSIVNQNYLASVRATNGNIATTLSTALNVGANSNTNTLLYADIVKDALYTVVASHRDINQSSIVFWDSVASSVTLNKFKKPTAPSVFTVFGNENHGDANFYAQLTDNGKDADNEWDDTVEYIYDIKDENDGTNTAISGPDFPDTFTHTEFSTKHALALTSPLVTSTYTFTATKISTLADAIAGKYSVNSADTIVEIPLSNAKSLFYMQNPTISGSTVSVNLTNGDQTLTVAHVISSGEYTSATMAIGSASVAQTTVNISSAAAQTFIFNLPKYTEEVLTITYTQPDRNGNNDPFTTSSTITVKKIMTPAVQNQPLLKTNAQALDGNLRISNVLEYQDGNDVLQSFAATNSEGNGLNGYEFVNFTRELMNGADVEISDVSDVALTIVGARFGTMDITAASPTSQQQYKIRCTLNTKIPDFFSTSAAYTAWYNKTSTARTVANTVNTRMVYYKGNIVITDVSHERAFTVHTNGTELVALNTLTVVVVNDGASLSDIYKNGAAANEARVVQISLTGIQITAVNDAQDNATGENREVVLSIADTDTSISTNSSLVLIADVVDGESAVSLRNFDLDGTENSANA